MDRYIEKIEKFKKIDYKNNIDKTDRKGRTSSLECKEHQIRLHNRRH